VLEKGGYSYVIYDDREWVGFPGGAQMESAVKSAVQHGSLVPVHQTRERLYTSRVKREFMDTNVYVFRVGPRS
jgi:hypothetical protein